MAVEGRILGLDVGERRTGVAMSDPLGIVATPYEVIEVQSHEQDAHHIAKLVQEHSVIRIVAGLPLDLEGKVGAQARKVLEFLDVLRAAVEVEVLTQDERFSTASASRALKEAGVRGKKRKKVIDKIAAQQILQLYLDRGAPTGGTGP